MTFWAKIYRFLTVAGDNTEQNAYILSKIDKDYWIRDFLESCLKSHGNQATFDEKSGNFLKREVIGEQSMCVND